MNRALLVAFLLAGAAASAQEIGSEIPISPPPGSGGPGGAPAGYVPGPPPVLSAKPFSLGIRANMTGSGIISQPSSAGSPGAVVPTVGIRLLVANAVAINVDAGLAIGILTGSGTVSFGATVGAGVDIRFRTEKDALRPFIAVEASFSKGFSGYYGDLAIGASVGGGAEYFFEKSFSMSARGMVGLMIAPVQANLVIATFTPGVLATVYF